MKRMNRLISEMFQGRGRASWSSSTASVGIGTCEKIVQEIICQHLDGRHWQERKEGARTEHAKHISKVRARPHADVFENVREYVPALEHAPAEPHQIFLEQD